MIVIGFVLAVAFVALSAFLGIGLLANNKTLSDRTAEAERRIGYLEGELRTQARLGDYAESKMADEVLRQYEAQFPAER